MTSSFTRDIVVTNTQTIELLKKVHKCHDRHYVGKSSPAISKEAVKKIVETY